MTLDQALRGNMTLDGGLGTELERQGCDTSGILWSAQVLRNYPEQVHRAHRSFLEAGADCIITASYQASFAGFKTAGLSEDDTERTLRQSVEVAKNARSEFQATHHRRALVAASVGPFGAALADGSEFHGNYGVSFANLVEFHARRMEILADAGPDLLACETIPSLLEAEAILHCLERLPNAQAWFTFACLDGKHVGHGEEFRDCVRVLNQAQQVVAIGVNCTPPQHVTSLIREACGVTAKAIVVYPNAGRRWDASSRQWMGPESRSAAIEDLACEWRSEGAHWIGGCCGTTPEDVARIRQVQN